MPNDWEQRFTERPVRTGFRLYILIALGLIAIGGVFWIGRMVLYPVQQAGRVVEKTLDADNMIYNYEWFKRQHADIIGMDTKVETARKAIEAFEESAGPRDGWKFEDRTERNRLGQIHQGLVGQRTSMIAEYNSKSTMANRTLFKDGELPDTIEDPANTVSN